MLTFGLETPRDLLEKLKRDAGLLDQEVTSDRFFNFVITGYSLIDWIKNSASVPATVRKAVEAMHNDHGIKICGDIATASKHFMLDRRKPITSSAESRQGSGHGRFGKGGYGIGEQSIQIALNDGSSLSCLELVKNVIDAWETFFHSHRL